MSLDFNCQMKRKASKGPIDDNFFSSIPFVSSPIVFPINPSSMKSNTDVFNYFRSVLVLRRVLREKASRCVSCIRFSMSSEPEAAAGSYHYFHHAGSSEYLCLHWLHCVCCFCFQVTMATVIKILHSSYLYHEPARDSYLILDCL